MQPAVPTRSHFDELHSTSLSHALRLLRSYGNQISDDHETALSGLCELSARMVARDMAQRVRFALPCGMGKTTTIRAILLSIYQLKLDARVVIASSKVEELCSLLRTLVDEDGIPPEFIGLQHSYTHNPSLAKTRAGFASAPAENLDAQFLLVTHANVRSGEEQKRRWMDRCDLVIFDESLIVGQPHTLPLVQAPGAPSVFDELLRLEGHAGRDPTLNPAATACRNLCDQLFEATKQLEAAPVGLVQAQQVDADEIRAARFAMAEYTDAFPLLHQLLDWAEAAEELRVFNSSEKRATLLTYTVAVPDSLNSVIVLDASDPVRELVHHDPRMVRAEDVLPSLERFRRLPDGLSASKYFSDVNVFFACDAAGRGQVTRELTSHRVPWMLEKLSRLIRDKPDESFLVFTYKPRGSSAETDLPKRILQTLVQAGIDPEEMVPSGVPGGDPVSRVRVMTWGQETGTNEFSSYKNVVLLGVARKPEEVVAATYLGQVGDLRCPRMDDYVRRLSDSECRHMLYQAMNRICMRRTRVVDGLSQAFPCNVYIWHFDKSLEVELRRVLPGCPPWREWREPGEELTAQDVVMQVRAELQRLQDQGERRISLRTLKSSVAPKLPKTTWGRARDAALALSDWWRDGNVLFYGFPEHSSPA